MKTKKGKGDMQDQEGESEIKLHRPTEREIKRERAENVEKERKVKHMERERSQIEIQCSRESG